MSRTWSRHGLVEDYLEQVCRHIKSKDIHSEIRLELTAHLDELVEDGLEQGVPETVAIRQAIGRMGDARKLGKQLHAAHKPVMEWSLISIVAIWVGIGLLAMYAMQFALSEQYGNHFLQRKAFYAAIGLVVLVGVYYLDYRKIRKYSWHLYGLTVLLMVLCQVMGPTVNGMQRWLGVGGFIINVHSLSPYMFTLAFAGIVTSESKGRQTASQRLLGAGKMAILFLLLPGALFMTAHSYFPFVVYLFGLSMLVLFAVKRYKLFLGGAVVLACSGAALFMSSDYTRYYLLSRVRAHLYDPELQSGGYLTIRSVEAIQAAGLWGKGFGAENSMLRYIHSDMVFSYLIYSLGWVFGAFLVVLALLFVTRIVGVCRQLKDSYAKGVVIGLFSIIGFQLAWNMMMSVGLLPIMGITLPFVSYGGMNAITELAVMGLILSVYRRKNRLPQAGSGTLA